jgi:ABC-type transporter Mla maintaining outer membrane lipid asymmetry ATPase subunit MlaF
MIETIEIENFRSFSRIAIPNCRRINIIVGDNGSGKTALLEAVFVAAGPSAETTLRTRAWRGGGEGSFQGTHEQMDRALWGDLFHNFNVEKPAIVKLKGTKDHTRSVAIHFQDEIKTTAVPKRGGGAQLSFEHRRPVEFEWKAPGGYKLTMSPYLEDGQIKFPPAPNTLVRSSFYAANRTYASFEVANRFSELSRTFRHNKFIDLLTAKFQNLEDLSVESVGGIATMFATVTGLSEKIPLSLASGGMNKLVAILLAFSSQPGGIVIIDEIESGFYYKKIPLVWDSILALAKAFDVQVFASTHSGECLRAAAELAENNIDEFSLFRTSNQNGVTSVRQIGSQKLIAAMEEDIELR